MAAEAPLSPSRTTTTLLAIPKPRIRPPPRSARPPQCDADPPDKPDGGLANSPAFGRVGARPVCFDATEGYVDTAVLWRPDLVPGATVDGPAVIEEFGSTVPLHPGFAARVDEYLNLIVTRLP